MNTLKINKGFTLIEVMVALFILTIGMLGSTAMMLRTQQQAEETSIETTAAQRAWNISELLRSSITNVNASSYTDMTVSPGGSAPTCISTGCDQAGMILLTRFLIGMELETYMPGLNAQAKITNVTGTPTDAVFKVAVTWDKLIADGSALTQTYEMLFQP